MVESAAAILWLNLNFVFAERDPPHIDVAGHSLALLAPASTTDARQRYVWETAQRQKTQHFARYSDKVSS